MHATLLIDPEKCRGCRVCEAWCSFVHEGVISPAKSRIRVIKWENEGLDIPMTCQQCEEPVCAEVCPVGAISRNEETGAMVVDEEACIGCRMCVLACPFGGCSMDPDKKVMVKCDLCDGDPMCVKMCPHEAITFVRDNRVAVKKKRESAKKLSELLRKIAKSTQ
jgi:Fe-S-cluster-containing hydrogenase component 2